MDIHSKGTLDKGSPMGHPCVQSDTFVVFPLLL